jgi:hypothetical protein
MCQHAAYKRNVVTHIIATYGQVLVESETDDRFSKIREVDIKGSSEYLSESQKYQ